MSSTRIKENLEKIRFVIVSGTERIDSTSEHGKCSSSL